MRTVRARLTLLFAGICAALLGTFAFSLHAWVRASLRDALDRDLETGRRLFVERFAEEEAEVRRGVHADLPAALEAFLLAGGGVARIAAPDGRVVFASPGFAPAADAKHFRGDLAGIAFRGRRTTIEGMDGGPYELWFAIPETPYRRHLEQIRVYLVLFLPLALVAAVLVGWLFVGRALAPVEAIRRQAERISRTNLSERVPLPAAPGEFRELAATFNEMLERLDKAFQDLEHFAADAAHELRTPLANLRAELETAAQERQSPESYEGTLASVAEEVARMQRIVSDLLTLARADLPRFALERERVAVGPLVEEARETWAPVAERRGIAIRVAGAGGDVLADPAALRRVFMNLVENAVKYNRDGGAVDVAVETHDGRVRVTVRDTGPGIPPADLPRLFHRFYRADASRSRARGGAGLGLAICKAFVQAHEGTIAVASAPEGTTFTVDLPAAGH